MAATRLGSSPIHGQAPMHACFVLAPRFTLLPFAGFIESLRHAADVADRSRQVYCRWSVVTKDGRPAVSSCGAKVSIPRSDKSRGAYDYVIVVGGLLPDCLDVGEGIFEFLHASREQGATLVGLCTGGFILAKAGLMAGRNCGVHLTHRLDLETMFPDVHPVTGETFVVDGDIVTCPGGTAAIDLATEIVSQRFGKARALKGLRAMLVDQPRAAHHLPSHAYESLATCGNLHVEKAIKLMEISLGDRKSTGDIAAQAGVSLSQLERAFAKHAGMSPSQFWRRMRLEHAHWMICNTHKNITNIAYECGFYDSTHFGKRFRQAYGETPLSLRKRNRRVVNLRRDERVV